MKERGSEAGYGQASVAWRRLAGYALGMLLEIAAVAALCSAALLLICAVRAIAT